MISELEKKVLGALVSCGIGVVSGVGMEGGEGVSYGGIVWQYRIRVGGRRSWVLDFAIPRWRIYIEVDGYRGGGYGGRGGHTTWAGFHRDRERDRWLVLHGWRGLRYGPGDLASGDGVMLVVRELLVLWGLVIRELEDGDYDQGI